MHVHCTHTLIHNICFREDETYWLGLRRYKYFIWIEPPYLPITYSNWENPNDVDVWTSTTLSGNNVKAVATNNHKWQHEDSDKQLRVICQTPRDQIEGLFDQFILT